MNRRGLLAAAAALAAHGCAPRREGQAITVFGAASLTDALQTLAAQWTASGQGDVRLSFAASGAVARQILSGAPAEVVVLADTPWMDRLQAAGRIRVDSRLDLLGNRLVLIAGPHAIFGPDPLADILRRGGRLAIGDPESVPAGAYARTWLAGVGRWDALQDRIVTAADVRAVRTFVARGEADLGVVYRSDTVGADQVRIVAEPPADQQPHIVYPAALMNDASPTAARFLDFLRSPEAESVFRAQGFEPIA